MSICDPKDKDREEEEKEGKGSRKDSMMVPAINFARRMSMKITGGAGPFTTNTYLPIFSSSDFLAAKRDTLTFSRFFRPCYLLEPVAVRRRARRATKHQEPRQIQGRRYFQISLLCVSSLGLLFSWYLSYYPV